MSELPSPLTALPDADQVVTFGASIDLPFFNKNQGARAEAAVLVRQAGLRRDLVEQTVRAEVTSAFRRAQAAEAALKVFEQEINTLSSRLDAHERAFAGTIPPGAPPPDPNRTRS